MIIAYLKSVAIYMIIIYATITIFESAIRENGWIDNNNKNDSVNFKALFCLAAVPIFRFFIVLVVLFMATTKKEKFEQWRNEHAN